LLILNRKEVTAAKPVLVASSRRKVRELSRKAHHLDCLDSAGGMCPVTALPCELTGFIIPEEGK